MSVSTFSSDFVHTALIQMGANQIKVVSGKQMVITFDLGNGLDLVYVLSVSNENKCFLQRARPYPMVHGKFASTEEILPFIERDYHAFLNARNSRNYGHLLGRGPEDPGPHPEDGRAFHHPQPQPRGPGPPPRPVRPDGRPDEGGGPPLPGDLLRTVTLPTQNTLPRGRCLQGGCF